MWLVVSSDSPAHIDTKEAQSFLSCWLELRKKQSQIYPGFDCLFISAVTLDAGMAGHPSVTAIEIATAICMPVATMRKIWKPWWEARYVRPSDDGWSSGDAAWFTFGMFLRLPFIKSCKT